MDTRGYQYYKEQSISTMTQGELLLLLYDELVKRLLHCDLALQKEDYALLDASVDRSIAILRYLEDTLDRKYPISRVKAGRNKTELDKIRPMVTELRDSFRTADKKSASENPG